MCQSSSSCVGCLFCERPVGRNGVLCSEGFDREHCFNDWAAGIPFERPQFVVRQLPVPPSVAVEFDEGDEVEAADEAPLDDEGGTYSASDFSGL